MGAQKNYSFVGGGGGILGSPEILALEKTKLLLIANAIQLSVVLIGTIFLGMLYDIIGVAIAFVLGWTMFAITLLITNYNYVGEKKLDI